MILTIIGVGVLSSTANEINTQQNELVYRRNFARAEAAVRQGAQEVTNTSPDDIEDTIPIWLHKFILPSNRDVLDPIVWSSSNSGASLDTNTRFVVVHHGVTTRTSLSMTQLKLHAFTIYGRSDAQNGEVILEVGFKRRM